MLELLQLRQFQAGDPSRKKEQVPRPASSQIASKRSQNLSGAPPSGIEASTGVTQTAVLPPVSSQFGASQEVKAMVQDMVKSSLTQLGVTPQETPTQAQVQSLNEDLEPPQIEGISSDGELSHSDRKIPFLGLLN